MSSYSIKSLEQYFKVYRKSIRKPKKFWAKIAENNFTGKLNYQGDKEGTEKGKWTPGFRYNYTVEINGSKIDPDLKQQVIEFKVDAVEDWTDVDQTPVTPNEVGE